MKELKDLFESAVLNDESKAVIQEAFDIAVAAKKTELEAEFATKLNESEQATLAQLPAIIEEAVSAELAVIAEEVAHARTLEVQYAEKLTAFKESYSTKQDENLVVLVAEAVAEEFEELKEDIQLAKKHEFVMTMFESFRSTYEQLFGGSDISVFDELKEAKAELDVFKRAEVLNGILENLQGDKRVIAATILEGVDTDKLEAKFESIRDALLKEAVTPEVKTLTEGKDVKEPEGKIVLESEEKEDNKPVINEALAARLQKSLILARG